MAAEEEEPKLSRFAKLLQENRFPDANSSVAYLLESEKPDKNLLEKILSKGMRANLSKFITQNGVTLIRGGKIYLGGALIENAYLVHDSELKKEGIDVTKLRMNLLRRIALDAKALIYILCREPKSEKIDYSINISPIGVSKVPMTSALSAEMARLKYAKDIAGYA